MDAVTVVAAVRHGLAASLFVLACSCAASVAPEEPSARLVMAYFEGAYPSPGDGLHLATSHDGLAWDEVDGGEVVFRPTVSAGFRDPSLVRGPDGTFHMVWTAARDAVGYAQSRDLRHWSRERLVPVMTHEPAVTNTWAPELFFDEASERFLLLWASTIRGRFPATEGTGDEGFDHRIYGAWSDDASAWGESFLFYDPGFGVIDATLVREDDGYAMYVKRETRTPLTKWIYVTRAPTLEGPWSAPSEPLTGSFSEGPSVVRLDGRWLLYFDRYALLRYGVAESELGTTFVDRSRDAIFPTDARHGCVLALPGDLLLAEEAPAAAPR